MIRFLRASTLFCRILLSYGWLWLCRRLLGRRRTRRMVTRCHERNARRLFRGIQRLRGVYIKLGQVLSILGGFLPPEYIKLLEGLQDQVEPQSYRTIRRAFVRDQGKPPEAIFSQFAHEPIAAASLGQVHRAALPNGVAVAVKVLYPNIDRIIAIDLRVIRWVFSVYRHLVPVVEVENIFEQLRDVLSRETDYHAEADNLRRLRDNFLDEPDILFPKVYDDLSSKRVLVMEFMEGIKITDVDELEAAGINRTEVASILVKSYYKQFLIDGRYHADPHPGNFLVQPGPQLVFLDFGAVEPVREAHKQGMLLFLKGIISQNDDLAIDGIETMGFVAPDGNRELLYKTVRYYFTKLVSMRIDDFSQIELDQLVSRRELRSVRGQLRELMRSVRYPEGFFFIERSIILLFGLCTTLDPKVNTLELGFPYAMKFILKEGSTVRFTAR